jgi:putative ABC transport system permease protein
MPFCCERCPCRLAAATCGYSGDSWRTARKHRGAAKEFSFAIWEQLRQQQKAFSGIAAWSTERFDLGKGGEARYADGLWVSGSFFQVLQVQPILGRLIGPRATIFGVRYPRCRHQQRILAAGIWRPCASALGSKLSLDGHPFEIIGVTPPSFFGLEVGRGFDVALPLCSEPVRFKRRVRGQIALQRGGWQRSAASNPGWTFNRASAQLASIAPGIYCRHAPFGIRRRRRKDYLRFGLKAEPAATGVSQLAKTICRSALGAADNFRTGIAHRMRKSCEPDAG